jgi:hypothetical protein
VGVEKVTVISRRNGGRSMVIRRRNARHVWIAILGGWLIMMGQQDRSEPLFYYFRLEDQVPEWSLQRPEMS